MESPPILIRRAKRSDLDFITSSWLKSNRDAPLVQGIPNTVYFHFHHKILEDVIPRSLVLVACDEDAPDLIIGWLCAEVVDTALVIHYAYTKYQYRRQGILKSLLDVLVEAEDPPAVMHTHQTRLWRKVARNKTWIYNPYLLFIYLPEDWSHDRETQGSDVQGPHPEPGSQGTHDEPEPATVSGPGRVSDPAGEPDGERDPEGGGRSGDGAVV